MKRQLDRFTVLEPLGTGGTGSVYRAEEILPGGIRRPVALKILPPLPPGDKAAEARFFAEVKAYAALSGHPSIVAFYSIGVAPPDNTPWIAMEFVPVSLAQRLTENPTPPTEVARMLEQVAKGLAFMHGLEPPLLHNDLKPANILVDSFGTYKITDFGLASLIAMDRTHVLATVRYAAPEVLSREFGRVCQATDLYALGHVAYEMALGGRAYRAQFPAVFEGHQAQREVPPARWMAWHCSLPTKPAPIHEIHRDFPRDLSEIIARMMAKPLAERYAGAPELLADLQNLTIVATPQQAQGKQSAFQQALKAIPAAAVPGAPAPVATPPKVAGPNQYYVRLRGKTTGPFDLATLQRQARQGFLSRLHQVSSDGTSWRPASSLEGVFGNSPPAE